jgi:hypothetical protein
MPAAGDRTDARGYPAAAGIDMPNNTRHICDVQFGITAFQK